MTDDQRGPDVEKVFLDFVFLQQNGREIFAACGVFELCKYGKGPILVHTFTTFLFANFVLENIIA